MEKQKILIVDDSEMNRILLSDILEGQYDVTEAENGVQAVQILSENETDFWFVLLDIMMPEMDGFEVLDFINKRYWNDRVVVMMISSDGSPENINRAYSLGAFDYIGRPFDPMIVRKRIANTLLLYARQRDLEKAVKRQFYEQQKNNDLMITILSHIVEFRNGESGLHIHHVRTVSELLLRCLASNTDRYSLTEEEIALISTAAAIHDVGKISIPEEILNKPGKLTPEEFAVMKTHTTIGAEMLSGLPIVHSSSPLVNTAYAICRWHHERYDGRGYPDGLKGEEIPIAAQVVSLADVYDALVSERCYKKAFSHEEALSMIMAGQCGAFNPLLLQCLDSVSDRLKRSFAASVAAPRELLPADDALSEPSKPFSRQDLLFAQPEYVQLLYIDPLTSLYNRRYYTEYIQNQPGIEAVALVTLNGGAPLHALHGQETVDFALRHIAGILPSLVRKDEHVIRFGNAEFLIVFHTMAKSAFKSRLRQILHFVSDASADSSIQPPPVIRIGGVYTAGDTKAFFAALAALPEQLKAASGRLLFHCLDEQAHGGQIEEE